ncbi:MAG: hypothetical protein ACREP7_13340 [Lysobacter sp.]
MNSDPYRAPASAAAQAGPGLNRWAVCVAILAVLQTFIASTDQPSALQMTREGLMAPVILLAFAIGHAALLAGAAALWRGKAGWALLACAVSVLAMGAALADWRPPLMFSGFGIAVIALLLAVRLRAGLRTNPRSGANA